MRVVQVLGTPGMGGAQRLVLDLIDRAMAGGHWQHAGTVFLAAGRNTWLDDFRERGPVHVHYLTLQRPLDPLHGLLKRVRMVGGRLLSTTFLPRLLRQLDVDVVHLHDQVSLPWVLTAARRAKLPLLWTLHSSRIYDLPRWERGVALVEARRGRPATTFVGVSSAGLDAISKAYPRAVSQGSQVVNNGVKLRSTHEIETARREVRGRLGLGEGHLVLGAVSRMIPSKRLDRLVDALHLLRSRGQENVRLLLAGDGLSLPALREKVQALGLSELVHLPGEVEDGWRYLAALDLLAICSEFEGMPISLLEAAGAGVPVLAPPIGEIPLFLQEGRCGLVLHDSEPEKIAAAVASAFADRDALRAVGERGRREVESAWSVDSTARTYAGLYGRLARGQS